MMRRLSHLCPISYSPQRSKRTALLGSLATPVRCKHSIADTLRRRKATQETRTFYGGDSSAAGQGLAVSEAGDVVRPDFVEGYALPPTRPDQIPLDGSSAAYPPLRGQDSFGRTSNVGSGNVPSTREKVFLNHRGGTDANDYDSYGNAPLGGVIAPPVGQGGSLYGNPNVNPTTLASVLTKPYSGQWAGEERSGVSSDSHHDHQHPLFDSYSIAALADSLPRDVLYGERTDVATILRYQQYFEQKRFEVKESLDAKHNWASPKEYYHANAVREEVNADRVASGTGLDASEEIAKRSS